MTWEVAGFRPATLLSQQMPASSVCLLVRGWCQAMCVARQPIGTERVKLPWIKNGLPFSSMSIKRTSPTSVKLGSHEFFNSRAHSWVSIARLLEKVDRTAVSLYPSFAGKKKRKRGAGSMKATQLIRLKIVTTKSRTQTGFGSENVG